MQSTRWALLAILVAAVATAQPCFVSASGMQKKAGKQKESKEQDPERAIANLVQGMQLDLESSSSGGFLSKLDPAKFKDYARFEEMIEQLTGEDTLRVYFRQDSTSVKGDTVQTLIDAEMEMTRKDAATPPERRRRQLVIDFERTSRGWRIINLAPRDFFQPL